jgi:hypothetical protein
MIRGEWCAFDVPMQTERKRIVVAADVTRCSVVVIGILKVRLDGPSNLHIAGNIFRQHETIGNIFGHYCSYILQVMYRLDGSRLTRPQCENERDSVSIFSMHPAS